MINGLEKKRECRHIPGGIKSRQEEEEEDDDDFFFFGSGRWLNIKRVPFFNVCTRTELPLGRSSSRDTNQAGRRNEPAYHPLITIQLRAAILTEKDLIKHMCVGFIILLALDDLSFPRDWINEPLAGNQETYSYVWAQTRLDSGIEAIAVEPLGPVTCPFKTSNTVTWLKMEKRGGVGHFKRCTVAYKKCH